MVAKNDHRYLYNIGEHTHQEIDDFMDTPSASTDEGVIMCGGGATWSGYEKICDMELLAAAAYVNIVGLSSQDDMIGFEIDLVCGATGAIFLQINGDAVAANYGAMRVAADAAAGIMRWVDLAAGTQVGLPIASGAITDHVRVTGTLNLTQGMTRQVMAFEGQTSAAALGRVRHRVGNWTDTATDITYIKLTSSVANVLGAGTKIRFYRTSLWKKCLETGGQFAELAPQGCYRGLWRCEAWFSATGERLLRSYPALTRHANHWRVDVRRNGYTTVAHDNWDTILSNVQSYVHIPNSAQTWSALETDPVVPGVGRATWQVHYTGYPTDEAPSDKRHFDIIIAGQNMLTMFALDPNLAVPLGTAEFGIKTNMFFKWLHTMPPNDINYNMSGRWDGYNQISLDTTIPTSVYADTDTDNWRMGPFGVFVYDNGTDTVVQGIPVDIEPIP